MDNINTTAIRVADAVRGSVFGCAFGTFSGYWAFYLINEVNWGGTRSAGLWATPAAAFRDAQPGMISAAGWGLLMGALYWLVSLYIGFRFMGSSYEQRRLRRMDMIRCGIYGTFAGPVGGMIATAGVYDALYVYGLSLAFWGMLSGFAYSWITMYFLLGQSVENEG